MPTRRIGGFLCYLPHIHLAKGKERRAAGAKFWLEPVDLERNHGLRAGELRDARRIVEQNRDLFIEMWNEHCKD